MADEIRKEKTYSPAAAEVGTAWPHEELVILTITCCAKHRWAFELTSEQARWIGEKLLANAERVDRHGN